MHHDPKEHITPAGHVPEPWTADGPFFLESDAIEVRRDAWGGGGSAVCKGAAEAARIYPAACLKGCGSVVTLGVVTASV